MVVRVNAHRTPLPETHRRRRRRWQLTECHRITATPEDVSIGRDEIVIDDNSESVETAIDRAKRFCEPNEDRYVVVGKNRRIFWDSDDGSTPASP